MGAVRGGVGGGGGEGGPGVDRVTEYRIGDGPEGSKRRPGALEMGSASVSPRMRRGGRGGGGRGGGLLWDHGCGVIGDGEVGAGGV